ncbi:MFS transporter [Actinomadura rifamycini]|uniref:MFS transporter n=1 Tax=Actinomadura rifamycini TaxID=31962 RepID=UPI0004786837|nr:MFS transporter [Actinomadura rifamycini]
MSLPESTVGEQWEPPPQRKTRAPLPRNFSLLWLGSATSQLGSTNAAIAFPLLALALTHDPVFAGWVTAAGTFPSLLLYLPAGMVVDRFDRRRLMVFCQIARCTVVLSLAIGILTLATPKILLISAAALDRILASFYNLAETTLVRRIVPENALPEAMARNEARSHIALLLGRPLGGFLYNCHRSLPFVMDALSALASVAMILKIKPHDARASPVTAQENPEAGFWECVRFLLKDPFLRMVLSVCAVTNFAFQVIFLMLIIQAENQYDSGTVIGLLFTASGLGGTVGAVAAPRLVRKRRPLRAICFSVWGWVLPVTAVWVFDHPVAGFLAWAVISVVGAHVNVALTVHQARHVPDQMLARVAGVNNFVTRSAVPLGALFAGYLLSSVDETRNASLLVLCLTLCVAVSVSVYGLHRRRTQVRRRARSMLIHLRTACAPQLSPPPTYHDPTDEGHLTEGVQGGVAGSEIATRPSERQPAGRGTVAPGCLAKAADSRSVPRPPA